MSHMSHRYDFGCRTAGPSVTGVFIDEIFIPINISQSRIGATAFLVNDPPVSHLLALFSVGELPWEKSTKADGKVDGEAQASLHYKRRQTTSATAKRGTARAVRILP